MSAQYTTFTAYNSGTDTWHLVRYINPFDQNLPVHGLTVFSFPGKSRSIRSELNENVITSSAN